MRKSNSDISLSVGECADEEFFAALNASQDEVSCVDVDGLGGLLMTKGENGELCLYIDCPACDSKIRISASALQAA